MISPDEIHSEILTCATSITKADGTPYRSLSVQDTLMLARRLTLPVKEIEISALSRNILPERYSRNFDSISSDEQIKLLNATVAVVGLGGLGGCVVETLARIGIGALTIMDGDLFEDGNLNRQVLCSRNTLGEKKAVAASRRIADINPAVSVTAHSDFISEKNAVRRLSGVDVIADCLDNIPDRFVIQQAAAVNEVPMVSAAVAGWSGQLITIFPGDAGLSGIYGSPESTPGKGVETILGNLPFTVSVLANLQCAEIVKVLLKKKGILRNRLMLVDLSDQTFDVVKLETDSGT